MGYVEQVMGDNEHTVYRTRLHIVVLGQRLLASLFAFLVFLGLGLVVLVPAAGKAGDEARFVVGVIALGTLVLPVYLIIAIWMKGRRGRDLAEQIWRPALAGVVILAVALFTMFRQESKLIGWIAAAVAVVPAAEAIRILLDWLNERFLITNRRVMEVRGIINKHVRDSALEKVNDVQLEQSIVGRLLGYGTVQIITGSDIGINMFRRISNPVRFKREMLNAKEGLQSKPSPAAPEEMPAAAEAKPGSTPATSIPDLIVELAELHQQGVITEEEFQAKKKELLDRL